MAESTGENSQQIPKTPMEAKNSSAAREGGSLTPEGLERIYDLKQADQLLESVGSELPEEQKHELDTSVSSRLAEQVGYNLDLAQLPDFLNKWDTYSFEEQNTRISTALQLLEKEEISPNALGQKRQRFVSEVARAHETQRHQNVKALSDKEIRQWDELTSKQGLSPEERMRLGELRQRASQELVKALGPLGMRKGALPLLVNPEVRKNYERLLKDEKGMQKIEALRLRLQIGKGIEQSKEPTAPLTHQKFQELLLRRVTDIKDWFIKSGGDYRFWTIPNNALTYTETQLIPTVTEVNSDIDGILRLIQSIMDVRMQFAYSDIPRVGALRELAKVLPKETGSNEDSGLSETGLIQRKTEASKQLEELKDIFKRSGDQRLWMLPNQVCDTARTLIEEITIGGDNPSKPSMILARLNAVEGINKHYRETYLRK